MKKNLTIWDQIEAAQEEVANWPDSIKRATEIQYAVFGADDDNEKLCSTLENDNKTHSLKC